MSIGFINNRPAIIVGTNTLPLVARTAEAISGAVAVALNQSGQAIIAMAAVSGRMPAVGITVAGVNTLSGQSIAVVQMGGANQYSTTVANYSGYIGKRVWVGRSGQITTISGTFSSGGFASGDFGQSIGIIANSGAIWYNVDSTMFSGGPLGMPGVF